MLWKILHSTVILVKDSFPDFHLFWGLCVWVHACIDGGGKTNVHGFAKCTQKDKLMAEKYCPDHLNTEYLRITDTYSGLLGNCLLRFLWKFLQGKT